MNKSLFDLIHEYMCQREKLQRNSNRPVVYSSISNADNIINDAIRSAKECLYCAGVYNDQLGQCDDEISRLKAELTEIHNSAAMPSEHPEKNEGDENEKN